jgi:hypothetical protein
VGAVIAAGVPVVILAGWLAAALAGEVAYWSSTDRLYRSPPACWLVEALPPSVATVVVMLLASALLASTGVVAYRSTEATAYRSALGRSSPTEEVVSAEIAALG